MAQRTPSEAFRYHIGKNYKVPSSVQDDCNWSYAIVKVSVDPNHKIDSLLFLNNAQPHLTDSFSFLKGYSFGPGEEFKNRKLVFILSLELDNWKTCKTTKIDFTPTAAITRVLTLIDKELSVNPGTIVLHQPIVIGMGRTEN